MRKDFCGNYITNHCEKLSDEKKADGQKAVSKLSNLLEDVQSFLHTTALTKKLQVRMDSGHVFVTSIESGASPTERQSVTFKVPHNIYALGTDGKQCLVNQKTYRKDKTTVPGDGSTPLPDAMIMADSIAQGLLWIYESKAASDKALLNPNYPQFCYHLSASLAHMGSRQCPASLAGLLPPCLPARVESENSSDGVAMQKLVYVPLFDKVSLTSCLCNSDEHLNFLLCCSLFQMHKKMMDIRFWDLMTRMP